MFGRARHKPNAPIQSRDLFKIFSENFDFSTVADHLMGDKLEKCVNYFQ